MAVVAQMLVLAAAGFVMLRFRAGARKDAGPGSSVHRAAFEQSPNSMLVVDADSLKVVDANAAAQRNLGYTLDQFLSLTAAQLFTEDGSDPEAPARKLRDP